MSLKKSENKPREDVVALLRNEIRHHVVSECGKDARSMSMRDCYTGLAYTIRERLVERWIETQRKYYDKNAKRVYYLSLEFLAGRSLKNNLINLGLEKECRQVLDELGYALESVEDMEWDAGLGNGGLGRLASCFLDSMATLDIAGYGYGIRYDYGIFYQQIQDGFQMEKPDNWMRFGNPWEFERPQHLYEIEFYGETQAYNDAEGQLRRRWVNTQNVMAMACDTMIPGFRNDNVINMRLWAAKASREFNLEFFQQGDYIKSIEEKARSENISKVLYPDDTREEGQKLRLKQQYFFVAATIQDILRRSRKECRHLREIPERVAIQLNDTHPAIAIPELMRVLMDIEHLSWNEAWAICEKTFSYTNHTVLPEALEHWPVALMSKVLPRHMEIIYEINGRFLERVREHFPGEQDRLRRMSIIDENHGRRVRMAHLALVGSHAVNGVSALHSEIIRQGVFGDFAQMFPERFKNVTNGVTPRRWMVQANPGLGELLSEAVGPHWMTDLSRLEGLRAFADDAAFCEQWMKVKRENKKRVSDYLWTKTNIRAPWHFMFDVQVKRIHEYKRQLLNVLHVITLYNRIRKGAPGLDCRTPRVAIFGGKAAPAYHMAKLIIKLIHAVGQVVNNDPVANELLRVIFAPNYCVSNSEKIIPATDLSEQISMAGTEASGTGNMKFSLNGALTIGTLDGANVEMAEFIGRENFFIFGLDAPGVGALKAGGYDPRQYYRQDAELRQVLDMIESDFFSPQNPGLFRPIIDALLNQGDRYLLLADYRSYMDCQEEVARVFQNEQEWARRSILNTAGMGNFSSDRAIMEYATHIWKVKPLSKRRHAKR